MKEETVELKYWTDTEIYRLAFKFFKAKKKDISIQYQVEKQWKIEYFNKQCEELRKVNELDHISFKRISKIIDFILNDPFWNTQVHWLSYLRKKNDDKVRYCFVFLTKIGWQLSTKTDMKLEPPAKQIVINKTIKEEKQDKEIIDAWNILLKRKIKEDFIKLQKLNEE
jgi:hypothetical protein